MSFPLSWGHAHLWASGCHRGRAGQGVGAGTPLGGSACLQSGARHWGRCPWSRPPQEGRSWRGSGGSMGRVRGGPCGQAANLGLAQVSPWGQCRRQPASLPPVPPGPPARAPRGPARLVVTRGWKSSDLVLPQPRPWLPAPHPLVCFPVFPFEQNLRKQMWWQGQWASTQPCDWPGPPRASAAPSRACCSAFWGGRPRESARDAGGEDPASPGGTVKTAA